MFRRTPKYTLPETWQPKRRVHGSFFPVYRNKETNQLDFGGRGKDEKIELVVRKHPIFLVQPALPAVGIFVLIVVFPFLLLSLPNILLGVETVLSLAFLVALGYFAWRDLSVWWFHVDIITNKRVIRCTNVLTPKREEIQLDKILQILVVYNPARGLFLNYGNVVIHLAGNKKHTLENVRRPQAVRDALEKVQVNFKTANVKAPPEPLPPILDPELKMVLEKLGKKEKEPEPLPNPDKPYEHTRNPNRLPGPLRRFGGPLRISTGVHYVEGEHTVMYIQRSKWLLFLRVSGPVALFLMSLVAAVIFSHFALYAISLGLLVSLLLLGWFTLNFIDDVFVLTNKRVIDIERKFFFFDESHKEVAYDGANIKVDMRTFLHTMLDVGTITVEKPGGVRIIIDSVDHPFFISDRINDVKGFEEKAKKAKEANKRQEDLMKWFTSVASVLEKRVMARQGVPDLQRMDLWSAAAKAAEMGMKVVPIGEDDSYPDIEPGHVVAQNPLPGTLMSTEAGQGLQIHVTLSKPV
jgi:hypothetical protein